MSEISDIARTVANLATHGMKPKELIAAVRKVHPDATKKEITRAAFYAVIESAEHAPEKVEGLNELAWDTRNDTDDIDARH